MIDIEYIQFDDATIQLGVDNPMEFLTPIENQYVVTEGEFVSFEFLVRDLDDDRIELKLQVNTIGSISKMQGFPLMNI